MARPPRMSLAILGGAGVVDPYASLRTGAGKYRSYWPMNEGLSDPEEQAFDKAGLYDLLAISDSSGGCPPVAGGGRETVALDSRFTGPSAYDLSGTFTVMGWYNRRINGGLTVPFGNRAVAPGQMLFLNGGAAWNMFVMNPGQTDTGMAATGTSFQTWQFFAMRHDAAAKTFSLRINDAVPGGTATGSYTGSLAAAQAFQVGGDGVTTFTTTWHRALGVWDRLATAEEETLLFTAGSTFIL